MTSVELLRELQRLDSGEKLKVIEILAGELAVDEEKYFQDGTRYDFWSPVDAPEAANVLLMMLQDEQTMNSSS